MLKNNETDLLSLDDSQVRLMASFGICSDSNLDQISQTVQQILHDCTKDGLTAVLNRIQLSKNLTRSKYSVEQAETRTTALVFSNGLDGLVESGEDDLEKYADMMEDLSGMQEVESRIENRVDRLIEEDNGFLKQYEAFSFCSTA